MIWALLHLTRKLNSPVSTTSARFFLTTLVISWAGFCWSFESSVNNNLVRSIFGFMAYQPLLGYSWQKLFFKAVIWFQISFPLNNNNNCKQLLFTHQSFSLESGWQQVSSSLQDSSQYSGRSVVWMVFTRLPNSKSSSPFSNHLVAVPNAPITIGIIVTCMFHSFFNSLARSRYLSFFSHSFSLFCGQPGQQSRQFCKFSSFCWLLLDLVFWSRLGDLCECQSPIGDYVCHFLGQVLGCAYTICLYG